MLTITNTTGSNCDYLVSFLPSNLVVGALLSLPSNFRCLIALFTPIPIITAIVPAATPKTVNASLTPLFIFQFLQPIYNKTQRDVLWDLEAAFMDKNDFSTLMDDVIVRENLPGNEAGDPKKKVRIMVRAFLIFRFRFASPRCQLL
jgi:hypothetical protein